MKKVSEWLNELGTHSILDCEAAKKDFTEETGEPPCWGDGYSGKEMQRQIDGRGKGGSLDSDHAARLIGACDVAFSCYHQFAGDEVAADKYGMGSQFREYVGAIQRNGK